MSHTRIQPNQQLFLLTRRPLENVLTETQLEELSASGKLLASDCDDKKPCKLHIHMLDADGNRVYRFSVSTYSPKWHVDVFVHDTHALMLKNTKSRPNSRAQAITLAQYEPGQKEGLLAELHFSAEGLSELIVVHEAVHAGGHLARHLGVIDAKKLASRITNSQSTINWREEIQCRTVELICKEIVTALTLCQIPCIPLIKASLY